MTDSAGPTVSGAADENPSGTVLDGFHVVIPAGGAGTRLWPLSRSSVPKFLHDLTGARRTLLQSTWDRLVPLAGPAGINVVTGRAHGRAVQRQLPDLDDSALFLEPSPKDSAPAIALATAVIARRDPRAVIGSFAADHVVGDLPVFDAAVREAVATARAGYLVTIGIKPTHAATGYGYIRCGEGLGIADAADARAVTSFVEKPAADVAAEYLRSGDYRWNAGMFVFRADVLLDHLAAAQPELYAGISQIADAWDTPKRDDVLDDVWPGLPKIAIDYAAAEPLAAAGGVAVVPGDFWWDDVGDFAAIDRLNHRSTALERAGVVTPTNDLTVLGNSTIVSRDSNGIVVADSKRVIAVVGIDDVVVVDTPDALLVTTRAHAQDVKKIVEELRAEGHDEVL